MKKLSFAKLAILSMFLLATIFVGCADDPTPTSGTTFQSQIDAAAAGSTVTLNRNNSGTSIVINKALTVDGNNIENLSIVISPTVRNNVVLRNFRNASISVAASSRKALANRSLVARTANANGNDDEKFDKIGDDALPLYLEGCTIDELNVEDDIALYLDNGDNKSVIDELKLKEGVDEFSFIEFDENGKEVADKPATPTASKSKVGKLIIEDDEVDEINLIGGVFDDVDFANGVSAADIDMLKYDKEFGDQFGNAATTDLLNALPASKKEDVAIAEHASGSGVYKFTMTRTEFNTYNGDITIVFLTETQRDTVIQKDGEFTYWTGAEGSSTLATVATYDWPVYAAIPAGHFMVNDTTNTGLKAVQGAEFAYGNYAQAAANGHPEYLEREDIVVLSHYRNYNKEAFIVDLGADTVDIYVNTAAIKKSDLVVCVGQIGNEDPKAEYGSKVSEMDLTHYTPYIAINRNIPGFQGGGNGDTVTIGGHPAIIAGSNDLPYGASLKLSNNDLLYALFTMTSGSYPNVSSITYPNIAVPAGSHHPFEDYLNGND